MKKLLFLLAVLPALALAQSRPENGTQRVENGAHRFDKANEGAYFGGKERINPTSRDLRATAIEQGVPISKKRGFPLAAAGTVTLGGAVDGDAEAAPVGTPAPSYRTLGDAAKAGVDPLSLVKPMVSAATEPAEDGKYDLLYWAGGILGFIVIGGLFFLISLRTPRLRED
jgi:hypothetical protein